MHNQLNTFNPPKVTSYQLKAHFGFTLVEIVMVLGVVSIIMTTSYFFVRQMFFVQQFSYEQTRAISEARRGVETMVKEIREIQTADNGAFPLILANPNELIFYADIDKDNLTERTRYYLQGSTFYKGTIEPRQNPISYLQQDEVVTLLSQFIHNTTTPAFRYYNGDWPGDVVNNPLVTPVNVTSVKYISITLVVNVNPLLPPADFTLTSDVTVRNLKENL